MAFTPQQQSKLGKAIGKSKAEFKRQYAPMLLGELQLADQHIQRYVQSLPALFDAPLDAGSRVIVRSRIAFLMARGTRDTPSWLISGQRLGDTWSASAFEQALEHRSPGGRGCEFSPAQARTLDGLCEHYAVAIRNEHLMPAIEGWLDGETAILRETLGLGEVDFASIRSMLYKQVQAEIYGMMVLQRPMELGADPKGIRENPYSGGKQKKKK